MYSSSKESLELIENAKKLSAENEAKLNDPYSGMDVICAADFPLAFTPPDELLEGIFVCGEGSVIYGASNSGKTFIAIDMAAAISQGTRWMGKRTEAGLVLYLAAEAPASVQRRLQAYQKHYQVKLNNIYVVRNPLDLFSGPSDSTAIIQIVRNLEQQTGSKVRLIVGDTLARLSAGANENAGQDMGIVIKHFDSIRSETESHFSLVHHSGKNAAAGQRGWSGVRAAIDTELEVTDDVDGRCIEITKQRDLDSKGERIGFRLEPVEMGLSKWGHPVSTCIVLPWEAPEKTTSSSSRKNSQIAIDVYKFLLSDQSDSKPKNIADHFAGKYTDTSVYRTVRQLIKDKQVVKIQGKIVVQK